MSIYNQRYNIPNYIDIINYAGKNNSKIVIVIEGKSMHEDYPSTSFEETKYSKLEFVPEVYEALVCLATNFYSFNALRKIKEEFPIIKEQYPELFVKDSLTGEISDDLILSLPCSDFDLCDDLTDIHLYFESENITITKLISLPL